MGVQMVCPVFTAVSALNERRQKSKEKEKKVTHGFLTHNGGTGQQVC